MLRRSEHGPAEGVHPERGLIDQVLGDHRRLIVGARDLLHHDATLAVELVGVDRRAPHEVGQEVDRLERPLGPRRDVKGDQVVAGVGVQLRADALGGLVDVAVVRILLAALEHEVLEEVGHAVLLGALGAGTGVEGHEDRHGTRAVDRDPMERQLVAKD